MSINAYSQFGEVKLLASLEFGNGDILVTPGKGDGYSCVMFKTHESHKIGTEHDTKGKTSDEIQPEVIMFFNNPESIDVVIKKLLEAKQNLTQ